MLHAQPIWNYAWLLPDELYSTQFNYYNNKKLRVA